MITVKVFVLGVYRTNCYVISNRDTKEAIVIDPADRAEAIEEYIEKEGLRVKGILLTHGHFDHICGVEDLKRITNAKVYACLGEKELLEDALQNGSQEIADREVTVCADVYVKNGEELKLAGITLRVIETPGHTRGSVCYLIESEKLILSGDTLFLESIGRTDLPTGNGLRIIESIREKLMVLEDSIQVLPGHGEPTSIGYEKKNNPYF